MIEQCPICNSPKGSDSGFCPLHNEALGNLQKGYNDWKKAYPNMKKTEYYQTLEQLQDVGVAIKDVIRYSRYAMQH